MGNFIANVFIWAWSNLIGWPREESRFTGFLRMCLYLYLMMSCNFGDSDWGVIIFLFCFVEFIIGMIQMGGAHSINGPLDFKLNAQIKEGIRTGEIQVLEESRPFESKYPGLTWWFRVRDSHIQSLTNTEKAKFFVETGALTEDSVRNLEKYTNTKRAIERLDFECRRPRKELINFMRGKSI